MTDGDRILLVGLADGALRGRRRERAEARVRALPDGARALARQRRVRNALGGAPVAVAEPWFAGWAPRVALSAAVALALAFAFALLPGGRSITTEAAALAAAPATEPAPVAAGTVLQARVDGVAFPNWAPELGWKETGSRRDTLDGRATRTVFYEHMGHRIAYTILPGAPIDPPAGGRVVRQGGLKIVLLRDDAGRDTAIFERDGRTCILAGHVERTSTLVRLAAWTGS
jgi:hypothetical protein